jgi:beta-glucosidase
VLGDAGASIALPSGRDGAGPFAAMLDQEYNRSAPLAAIRALRRRPPCVSVTGATRARRRWQARQADVAIVFATQYQTEGYDVPDLSLPERPGRADRRGRGANPNTSRRAADRRTGDDAVEGPGQGR